MLTQIQIQNTTICKYNLVVMKHHIAFEITEHLLLANDSKNDKFPSNYTSVG